MAAFMQAMILGEQLGRISGRLYPALMKSNRLLMEVITVSGASNFSPANMSSLTGSFAMQEAMERYADLRGLAEEVKGFMQDEELSTKLDEIQKLSTSSMDRFGKLPGMRGAKKKDTLAEQSWDGQMLMEVTSEVNTVIREETDRAMAEAQHDTERFRWLGIALLVMVGGGLSLGLLDYGLLAARRTKDYDELLQASVSDPETGLFKRSYYEQRLLEYINWARRKKVGAAVVLIPAASTEIVRLGQDLHATIRDYDLCARFDRENIALILNDLEKGQSDLALKRLGLSAGSVIAPGRRRCVLALFPEDGEKVDELLRVAQERLAEEV
jgi:GGDEF domain-containing protein